MKTSWELSRLEKKKIFGGPAFRVTDKYLNADGLGSLLPTVSKYRTYGTLPSIWWLLGIYQGTLESSTGESREELQVPNSMGSSTPLRKDQVILAALQVAVDVAGAWSIERRHPSDVCGSERK